jgi:5'-deoxynucleotidase YfbR-like HD superfamily hydrolase
MSRPFWVQTWGGVDFDLDYPEADKVRVEDIAHALSLQARFNGHTQELYSVAEHAVRVALEVAERLPGNPNAALCALHHDSAEAYVGDMVQPIKALMAEREEGRSSFDEIESGVWAAIRERFNLQWTEEVRRVVKIADLTLLATEVRDLFASPVHPRWPELLPPLARKIAPFPPHVARRMFLEWHAHWSAR